MIRLCISSQTPPTRPGSDPVPLGSAPWRLGTDYTPNVGGVVPMMRALLRHGMGRWLARDPRWVALGDGELPGEFRTSEGYWVETIRLNPAARARYVRFKEAVWRSFHGPRGIEPFSAEEYGAYVDLNHRFAQRLLARVGEYDLFYVNDYQLLLVGGLVGSAAPVVLRWHIPLEFRGYPEPVRRFFLKAMEGFDGIVVSTRAGLEELIRHGFHGRAFQVYPYIDPAEQLHAPAPARAAFRERFGLGDHPCVLAVGRLDPVKRQDLLIGAFAYLRHSHPDLRLVLAGGGSYSTRGPAAGSKTSEWEARLRGEIRRHRLEDRVVVTGDLTHEEVRAAYDEAELLAHAAPWEGFGLVVVEAWMHDLPVVVSDGAGVAELVDDGLNGFSVPAGSPLAIARRIRWLVDHPEKARRMGENGRLTARRCHVGQGARRLREIFERTMQLYGRPRTSPTSLPA